jgi:transposase-like protein
MAKLTQAQREEYVKHGGISCPFCKSPDIEGSELTVDSGFCFQEIACLECSEAWTDEYVLTGVSEIGEEYNAEDMARAIWAETLAQSEGR